MGNVEGVKIVLTPDVLAQLDAHQRAVNRVTDRWLRAVRRWANANGYEGRPGGWIYVVGSDRPICQGWFSFALRKANKGCPRREDYQVDSR